MQKQFLGIAGPLEITILVIVSSVIFLFPLFLIFYKKNEPEHSIPIWSKILLILPSITWVGIIIGLYISFRKKKYNNTKSYKFSSNTRFFGNVIILLSLICTIMYYINKNNPFQ